MAKVILLRHGQSQWNKLNLFTGWVDVPLSDTGINEALAAGDKLKDICFSRVYTSLLIRSIQTAMIALSKSSCGKTPVIMHDKNKMNLWENIENKKIGILPVYEYEELNERYYGLLQGQNKEEMSEIYSKEVVHKWRRSYSVRPPNGESLEDNCKRTIPFVKSILNDLKQDENILISAHGNSLRSIIMHMESLSEDKIVKVEVPTGVPILYEIEDKKIKTKKYL